MVRRLWLRFRILGDFVLMLYVFELCGFGGLGYEVQCVWDLVGSLAAEFIRFCICVGTLL